MEQAQLQARLWQALDRWCRWLSGALAPLGEGLYSLTPRIEDSESPYDAVAGDQFAAAAAGYWLARTEAEDALAGPLRGLIRFALGSHVAVRSCPPPKGALWGATVDFSNDWHAALFPAASGILLQGALDERGQSELRRIVEWEADFHAHQPVAMACEPWALNRKWPGRMPTHSNGESLAWTAALLQVARVTHPDHPRAGRWREAAVSHALNALSFPRDLTDPRPVAGRPLAQWVKGANFEPGGIQEHHGFFHPGYIAWPLASHALALLLDEQLPSDQQDPEAYLHHWAEVFGRLKQSCLANGRLIYAGGFDWNQYGYGNTRLLSAALFAAARLRDPLAARIADQYLGLIEFQQQRTGGATQGERLATQRKLFPNRYAWYEAIDGMTLAECLWMLQRLGDQPLADPCDEAGFHARCVSTYVEPGARLAWRRTEHAFASFSWRAYPRGIQALVQPLARPHLLKANALSTGVLEIEGAGSGFNLQWCELGEFEQGGFWTLGGVDHGRWIDGRNVLPLVHQFLGMAALPDGTAIWFDRCQAEQAFTLTASLALPVRVAADIFTPGQQVRLRAGEEERVFPQHPEEDTWHALPGRCVTVDDCLTLQVLEGEGEFHLLQKRRRDPRGQAFVYPDEGPAAAEESLLAHDLWFGRRQPRPAAPGQWVRQVTQVLVCHDAPPPPPEIAPPQPTPPEGSAPLGAFTIKGADPLAFVLDAGPSGRLLVNFTAHPQTLAGHVVAPRQVRLVRGR